MPATEQGSSRRAKMRIDALLLAALGLQFVAVAAHCPHDNLLRCFLGSPTLAITYCSWTVGIYPTATTYYETTTVTPEPTTTPEPSVPEHPQPTLDTPLPHNITVTVTETITVGTPDTSSARVTTPDERIGSSSSDVQSTTIRAGPSGSDSDPHVAATGDSSSSLITQAPPTTTLMRSLENRSRRPKTSLACLADLVPDAGDISSACSCFSSSFSLEPVTSTVTATPGPTCPGRQPTFPNCLSDFHPYNCGTDKYGVVACSCVLTTEGTAQCTLGDYERDNACTTSDDCGDGWYCTTIDCFDDSDVPSVCTRGCPVRFNVTESESTANNLFRIEPQVRNLSVIVKGKR